MRLVTKEFHDPFVAICNEERKSWRAQIREGLHKRGEYSISEVYPVAQS